MATFTRRAALATTLAAAACRPQPSRLLATAPAADGHPHILMQVVLRGRSLMAVIDNGAPVSSLDSRLAQDLGIAADGVLASGRATLPIQTFSAGGQSFEAVTLLDDLTELSIAAEQPIGALIGMDFFRAFGVGVVARQAIELYAKKPFFPPAGARRLELTRLAGGEPGARIILDGQPANALVDLGASAAVLVSRTFADRHRIGGGRLSSSRLAIVLKGGALTPSESRITSVAHLKFGGVDFEDAPVNVMPDDPGPFAPYDVVVGAPLLTKFELYFDLPGALWVASSGREAEPFVRRYTGLGVADHPQGLLVRHVAQNSPGSQAGIKAGDIIVRLNDAAPTAASLRSVAEGQAVSLALADGRQLSLTGARHY